MTNFLLLKDPSYEKELKNLKIFLFGGKAIFRVLNKKLGINFILKITKPPNPKRCSNLAKIYFVYLYDEALGSYKFIGQSKPENSFKYNEKSLIPESNYKIIHVKWFFKNLNSLPGQTKIYHLGSCAKCSKHLITKRELQIGFHNNCLKGTAIQLNLF